VEESFPGAPSKTSLAKNLAKEEAYVRQSERDLKRVTEGRGYFKKKCMNSSQRHQDKVSL